MERRHEHSFICEATAWWVATFLGLPPREVHRNDTELSRQINGLSIGKRTAGRVWCRQDPELHKFKATLEENRIWQRVRELKELARRGVQRSQAQEIRNYQARGYW